jgi:hypothetical protein
MAGTDEDFRRLLTAIGTLTPAQLVALDASIRGNLGIGGNEPPQNATQAEKDEAKFLAGIMVVEDYDFGNLRDPEWNLRDPGELGLTLRLWGGEPRRARGGAGHDRAARSG